MELLGTAGISITVNCPTQQLDWNFVKLIALFESGNAMETILTDKTIIGWHVFCGCGVSFWSCDWKKQCYSWYSGNSFVILKETVSCINDMRGSSAFFIWCYSENVSIISWEVFNLFNIVLVVDSDLKQFAEKTESIRRSSSCPCELF